ncbi:MAG: site-specific integrase [Clostridia bacterium]|nr:site-specific integrase [Clostridia bacterium]
MNYSNNDVAEMLKSILAILNKRNSDEPLGDFLRSWYSLYVRPKIKAKTSINYEMYLARITSALGSTALCDITPDLLQGYFNGITNGNTRKKQKFLLNRALNKAVALGKLDRNPFLATEIPGYTKQSYRSLEFDEQLAVLNRIKRRPYYTAIFMVLCCTGFRIGELLALDLNDIDFERGIISITKTRDIHTGEVHQHTKTNAGRREVPFLPELEPHLKLLVETPFPPYSAVRSYFRRVYNFLKIERANLHSLRHTFVSLAHLAGIKDKYLQTIVGHSDIQMTMDVYTHIMKKGTSPILDYIRELAKHLDEFYI